MKTALFVIGILLLIYAFHWVGQGTGLLPWPAHTLMDYNIAFAWYGAGLAFVALTMIWFARRG